MPATVSVVIRVKNSSEDLAQAVATVRMAEPSAEVVIVDNASTDDTSEVAFRVGDVVVHQAGSLGDCRLPGVERASREIVFFMDADQRVLTGTIADACRAISGHEAVVVPERPTSTNTLWYKVLATEREWAEASGLGRPRAFWRDTYLTYRQPNGILFGEDRVIAAQIEDVTTSSVPILHEEIRSPSLLLRKYYRYGRTHSGSEGTVDHPAKAALSLAIGATRLPWDVLLLVPAVGLLKLGKATAFYTGTLQHE